MGCDIHSYAERKNQSGKWEMIEFSPFKWRNYDWFGFLADVRNYSAIPPIAEPRGLPKGLSPRVREKVDDWGSDGHSKSWLSVAELVAFNYDAECEDRYMEQTGGICEPGQGKMTTFRKLLGKRFLRDVAKLQKIGAERVVFWFDN
jgi:hypothetical protein